MLGFNTTYDVFLRLALLMHCLLWFCAEPTVAQQPYNNFWLNADNGLAQNSVWDVVTDKEGFLWIGTANGLNRWDGVNINHYFPGKQKQSFPGSTGFSFYVDTIGYTWILHNKGISYYNPYVDSFVTVLYTSITPCFVGSYNNKLYVLVAEKRIAAISLVTKKIESYINIQHAQPYQAIAESNKSVVLGNFSVFNYNANQIMVFNLATGQYRFINTKQNLSRPIKLNATTAIFTNLHHTIKFVCNNSKIYTSEIVNNNTQPRAISSGIYWNNQLLLATPKGVFEFDTASFLMVKAFNLANHNLANNLIDNFFIDALNNLYVCSNISGLYIVSKARNKFVHLKTPLNDLNMVKCILVTPDDKLFTGQFGSHLVYYKPNGSYEIINFHYKEIKAIWGLCNVTDNTLLAVGFNKLYFYNHRKNKVEKTIEFSSHQDNQYPVFYTNDSTILLNLNTAAAGGIYSLNKFTYELKLLYNFKNRQLTTFLPMDKSRYFIGSREGLWLYQTATNALTFLHDGWVKSIIRKGNDSLVVAATNGLHLFNTNGKRMFTYNTENGLKDNFVYAALPDRFNNIWVSTNKGIGAINLNGKIKWYGVEDGLQSNEFNTGAYLMHQNKIYFGGVNGVSIILPEPTFNSNNKTNTIVNAVFVNDEPWIADSAINAKRHIVLDYNQNTISFDFASLDFSNHTKNTYRYFFSGIEKKWIDLGNKHFIRYAALPYGNYTLMLQSAGDNGIFGKIKTISITIQPPFWFTWWFKTILVCLIILTVLLMLKAYRWRLQQKAQIQLEIREKIENERLRISRDLHDNVGAHLSFVMSNIDMLEHDVAHQGTLKKRLKLAKDAGQQAIQTLRETIWAVNQNEINFVSLADRFKQYCSKFSQGNSTVKIIFHEDIKQNALLSPVVALNLFRVTQEAFHNALKHSHCTEIFIHFESAKNRLVIKVVDNGCGFKQENQEIADHYGLANMKDRMAEINGTLQFNSLAKGTEVLILLTID